MALLKQTTEETTQAPTTAEKQQARETLAIEKVAHVLLQPRLSEKAVRLNAINKYVFKVKLSANKIEVRKAVEKFYGVKVLSVNIIKVEGKMRRYGRTTGRTNDYKKAIVTLRPDSKKPEIMKGV